MTSNMRFAKAPRLPRVSLGLVARLLLAFCLGCASLSVAAQQVSFEFPFGKPFPLFIEVGSSDIATVRTQNGQGLPTSTGTLTWDLQSCIAAGFLSPPPITPDISGFTSADILGLADGQCFLNVLWDDDNDPMTPSLITSSPLQIIVVTPLNYAIQLLDVPAPIVPVDNQVFTLRITESGVPIQDVNLEWQISIDGQTPSFYGGGFSSQFLTDSNGEASFDLFENSVNVGAGTYSITVFAYDFFVGGGQRAPAPDGLITPVASSNFTFGMENLEIVLVDQQLRGVPQTKYQVGVAANVLATLRTTPSQVPVPGFTLDWFVSFVSATPENGSTAPTDGAGQTIISFTPTSVTPFGTLEAFENSTETSAQLDFGVFEPIVELTSQLPGTAFTDEAAPGITVLASKNFGSGNPQRGSAPNGFTEPLADVPVTFEITSGNAVFTANNSTQLVVMSGSLTGQTPGEASSSPIFVGRTLNPVTVTASAPGVSLPVSVDYPTTPSTYSIAATSPTQVQIQTGQSTQLSAQVLAASISTPNPLGPNETVTWTITPPANGSTVTPTTLTSASGIATTDFTPGAIGVYAVVGQFDPQISGVQPSTVSFSIQVDGPSIVETLVPFVGDLTQGPPGLQFDIGARYLQNGTPAIPTQGPPVLWTVVAGDASVSPNTSPISSSNGVATTTVTFGSQPGTVLVNAEIDGVSGSLTTFVLEIVDNLQLNIVSPESGSLTVAPGDPFEIQLALLNQVGAGIAEAPILIGSNNLDLPTSVLTDATGLARASGLAPAQPGAYQVAFTFDGSSSTGSIRASGTPPLTETVTVNVVEESQGVARIVPFDGDGQVGTPGQPAAPLKALYTINGEPVSGTLVFWMVSSGGGSPTSATTTTDANGIATFNYTFGPVAGSVIINASVENANTDFRISSSFAQLVLASGNNQRGPVQTELDMPLAVQLLDVQGGGLSDRNIDWTLVSGDATLISGTQSGAMVRSSTNATGQAQVQVRLGTTAGPVLIRATNNVATEVVDFVATAEAPGLRIVSGNNQTGNAGSALPEELVVSIAPSAQKAFGGVTVTWEVLSGGGSVTSGTTSTDANGLSRNQLVLGASPGTQQVRATVTGGGSVTFTAQGAFLTVAVSKVSGDNQAALPTNQDSAPLVVRVTRQDGQGSVPGVTIVWRGANAGFPIEGSSDLASETTSVTNAQGEARITARVIASGPASVGANILDSFADPVTFTLSGAIANTQALNANERLVAETLDNACVALQSLSNRTAAQEDLFQRCRELQSNSGPNPGDVSNALEQLDPEVSLAMTSSGTEMATTQISNVNNYLLSARNSPRGGGQFRIALATPTGQLPLSFLPSAIIAAQGEDSAEGQDLGPDFGRWGYFVSGTIGRGKYRDGQRTPDFDYNSGNITVGVDYRYSDSLILGGGIGYSRNDTDLRNDLGSVETSGLNLIGYASWYSEKQYFVDGVVTYGQNSFDLVRNVRYSLLSPTGGTTTINQIANASTDGDQLGLSLSVGRDWQTGPWSVNSYLRANYLQSSYDAYSERLITSLPGSGLALSVDARDLTNTSGVLGSRATYVMSRDWGILMPSAQLEFEHIFGDDPTRLVSRFTADPTGNTFIQVGDEIDTDFFNLGIGLAALWPGGRSAFINYERLVSSSRISQDTLSLGVRIEF